MTEYVLSPQKKNTRRVQVDSSHNTVMLRVLRSTVCTPTPKRIEQGYDAEEEAATTFWLAKTMPLVRRVTVWHPSASSKDTTQKRKQQPCSDWPRRWCFQTSKARAEIMCKSRHFPKMTYFPTTTLVFEHKAVLSWPAQIPIGELFL